MNEAYYQQRICHLESALALALYVLCGFEPPDSRAVSDEFVAMASVLNHCENEQALQIIADGMLIGRTYPDPAKVEFIEHQ